MLDNLKKPENQFVSYSQNREDLIIDVLLGSPEKGFYVDVGANDPVIDSVTKHFYDKGWTGINVEPIKKLHKLLVKSRSKDININKGISDKRGNLKLREYTGLDGHSTFSETTKKSKDTNQEYSEYNVEVITLKELFNKNKIKKIDFLKIDVEGLEDEVVKGNDWSLYRPTVVCLESDHSHKNWADSFRKWDYLLVLQDGLNEYYLAKESEKLLDGFSERLVATAHNSLKSHQYDKLNSMKIELDRLNREFNNEVRRLDLVIAEQGQKLKDTSYLGKNYTSRVRLAIHSLTSGWINREK